jgi:FkbM family methyltransferase
VLGRVAVRIASVLPYRALDGLARLQDASPAARRVLRRLARSLMRDDVTIARGEGAGLRFNAAGSAPSFALGTSERAVQSALCAALARGDVVYDIGANVGFITLLAASRVGPSGHVYAFEPHPSNVIALRRNIARNRFENVTVVPAAVTGRSGPVALAVASEPFWNRLSRLPPRTGDRPAITVAGSCVDDLVAAGDVALPDVVKIDVEGAEVEVLRGMATTIASSLPTIICELHGTATEVRSLLERSGFDVRPIEQPATGRPSRHVLAQPVRPARSRPA